MDHARVCPLYQAFEGSRSRVVTEVVVGGGGAEVVVVQER